MTPFQHRLCSAGIIFCCLFVMLAGEAPLRTVFAVLMVGFAIANLF